MEINLSFSASRQKTKQMLERQAQKKSNSTNIQKLGGIHLYNQTIQRHLLPQSKKQKGSNLKIQSSLQQEEEATDSFIRQFMQKRDSSSLNFSSIFSSEIQTIIDNLKHSHFATGRFLQQLRIDKQIGKNDAYSFEQLQKQELNRTKSKYCSLLARIQKQFRQRIDQQVNKLRQEQDERTKNKQLNKRQYGTQTVHDYDQQVLHLKKEIERRQAEYQALYDYKKDMITEGQRIIKQAEINVQFQKSLVAKLQTQIASKNIDIRSYQSQLKTMQDRFFCKVIEVQRLQNHIKSKQQLSSIHQISNISEVSQEQQNLSRIFGRLSNQKKKRSKQRAESVLSITQSLFSNSKDRDYFVSLADVAAKSVRDIQLEYGPNKGNKASKAQYQANKLFKILQLLSRNKRNNETKTSIKSKLSLKSKKMARTTKNLERLSVQSGIQHEIIPKRASHKNQSHTYHNENSPKVQKKEQEKLIKKKVARIQQKIETNHLQNRQIPKSKFFANKQAVNSSFQNTDKDRIQITLRPPEHKQSIIKGSYKNIAEISLQKRSRQSSEPQTEMKQRRKLKKGVSFQCQIPSPQDKLSLCSMEIDIILNQKPVHISDEEKKNKITPSATIDSQKQEYPKRRITKHKLVKSTIRHNIHKKASSLLQSHQMSSIIEQNPQTKHLITPQSLQHQQLKNFRNSTPLQMPFERSSYHFSQNRQNSTIDAELNRKISFSRVSRLSIGHQEKQFYEVRKLAKLSKNKEEFKQKFLTLHKSCLGQCEHVKKYLDLFEKWRQTKRTQLPLRVQNLNNNIKKSFPILQK